MKEKVIWLMVSCCMLATLLPLSCNPAMSPGEEASNIIGLPIPIPTYFPKGYEVTSVEVEGTGRWDWRITVTIDNTEAKNAEPQDAVMMEIHWLSLGLKIESEKIKIGDRTALVFRHPDHTQLLWIDSAGREITLTGNSELQFEELVQMAESVTSPPAQVLEASLDPQDDLVVLRGDSQQITVHLHNNSLKTISVTGDRYAKRNRNQSARWFDNYEAGAECGC